MVLRGETVHGFKVGGDSWTGGKWRRRGGRGQDGSELSQPVFMVDNISFMVNAGFPTTGAVSHEEDAGSPPPKSLAALRVLGDHLHCDGLHLRVLLQAVLSSGNRQQEDVTLLLRLFM